MTNDETDRAMRADDKIEALKKALRATVLELERVVENGELALRRVRKRYDDFGLD